MNKENMAQQTAVDYLIEQLWAPCRGIPSHIIEQAKQMESKQSQSYAEFCVRCDREGMKLLEFESFMNLQSPNNN